MSQVEVGGQAAVTMLDTPLGAVPVVARDCPGCAAPRLSATPTAYAPAPWIIRTCAACGLTFLDHAPDYAALSDQLAWEKSRPAETDRRRQTRPLNHRLSRATRARLRLIPRRSTAAYVARHAAPGPVLDIGCGDGSQLLDLPEGFIPFGIEISRELALRGQDNLRPRGGDVVHGPALDGLAGFEAESFTAATLRSYLEHEARPAAVLRALARVLRPDGVAVVKVPNYGSLNRRLMGAKWCGFRTPDHVNYFTPASLRALAAAAGFTCRFGLAGALPTSDNMWALLTRPAGAGR